MLEIYKKSVICFINEEEYNSFKESCMPNMKNFIGWEILREYDLIHVDDLEYTFKVTFDMRRIEK